MAVGTCPFPHTHTHTFPTVSLPALTLLTSHLLQEQESLGCSVIAEREGIQGRGLLFGVV
jgi:hypothetical protein